MAEQNTDDLQISQDKETILALVTHDLKNPVNAGMMAVKLLEDKNLSPLNPYQEELVTNLAGSYKYMKNLIENVLDRYKVINHAYKLNKTPVNFVSLINSAIEEYKFLFLDKEQKVRINSTVKNRYVNIDSLEIKRVVHNLITNAIKYAPQKSEIEISLYEQKNSIYCSIKNEGCTFDPRDNPFDKFYTQDTDSKTIATGLGLYIVKEVIMAHGGTIHLVCEPDKYTMITFSLPIK